MPSESTKLLPRVTSSPKSHPEAQTSYLSFLTFSWLDPILKTGYAKQLDLDDLFLLRPSEKANLLSQKLNENWTRYAPSLFQAIVASLGRNFYIAGICKLAADLTGFVTPLCIHELLWTVQNPTAAPFAVGYYGILVAITLFLVSILQSLLSIQYDHLINRESIRIRVALKQSIFDKAIRLENQVLQTLGAGNILNYQANDVDLIERGIRGVHTLWASPIQITISFVFLVQLMGKSALSTIVLFGFFVPLLLCLGSQTQKFTRQMTECADARVKMLHEAMEAIYTVKCYLWENAMEKRVRGLRTPELRKLGQNLLVSMLAQFSSTSLSLFAQIAVFTTYSLTNSSPLTPQMVFTALPLFQSIMMALNFCVPYYLSLVQARSSLLRLQEFFLKPEFNPCAEERRDFSSRHTAAIELQSAEFTVH